MRYLKTYELFGIFKSKKASGIKIPDSFRLDIQDILMDIKEEEDYRAAYDVFNKSGISAFKKVDSEVTTKELQSVIDNGGYISIMVYKYNTDGYSNVVIDPSVVRNGINHLVNYMTDIGFNYKIKLNDILQNSDSSQTIDTMWNQNPFKWSFITIQFS